MLLQVFQHEVLIWGYSNEGIRTLGRSTASLFCSEMWSKGQVLGSSFTGKTFRKADSCLSDIIPWHVTAIMCGKQTSAGKATQSARPRQIGKVILALSFCAAASLRTLQAVSNATTFESSPGAAVRIDTVGKQLKGWLPVVIKDEDMLASGSASSIKRHINTTIPELLRLLALQVSRAPSTHPSLARRI